MNSDAAALNEADNILREPSLDISAPLIGWASVIVGVEYLLMRDLKSALQFYKKALQAAAQVEDYSLMFEVYQLGAKLEMRRGDYQAACLLLIKRLKLSTASILSIRTAN